MKYSFITINYNNTKDTLELVNAFLFSNFLENVELFIVDNNSEYQNFKSLKSGLKKLDISLSIKSKEILDTPNTNKGLHVTLIPSKINLGFAGGNNIVLEEIINSKDDYIVSLINNDVIFDHNFTKEIINFVTTNKNSIISPFIYFSEPANCIWFNGGYFNSSLFRIKIYDYMKPIFKVRKNINFISGCCMSMHSSVLRKNGLFREDFFMYEEDLEFCIRAKKKDIPFKICYSTSIIHKVGSSTSKLSQEHRISDFSLEWMVKNRFKLIFEQKNIFTAILPLTFNLIKNIREANTPHLSATRTRLVFKAIANSLK